MCLDSLLWRPIGKITTAYKVVCVIRPDVYVPTIMFGLLTFHTGCWVDDPKSDPIFINTDEYYQTGFHCFLNVEDARSYVTQSAERVVEVKVENIVASGRQWTRNKQCVCIVARRIKIVKEV